jgi:hypothetical protein
MCGELSPEKHFNHGVFYPLNDNGIDIVSSGLPCGGSELIIETE